MNLLASLVGLTLFVTSQSGNMVRRGNWLPVGARLNSVGRGVIFAAILAAATNASGATPTEAQCPDESVLRDFRGGQYGNENSLYFLLRLLGKDLSYVDFRNMPSSRPCKSLTDVQLLARRHDLSLEPRRLPASAPWPQMTPMLVHISEPSRGEPFLCVLLSADDDSVLILDGPTVAIQRVSMDEFRRRWTGVALTRSVEARWSSVPLVLGLVAGVGGWFLRRVSARNS